MPPDEQLQLQSQLPALPQAQLQFFTACAAPVENASEGFVNPPRRLARRAVDATIPLSCRFYSIGSI